MPNPDQKSPTDSPQDSARTMICLKKVQYDQKSLNHSPQDGAVIITCKCEFKNIMKSGSQTKILLS